MSARPEKFVHDILGVGFGPSNLALAIAAHESGHAGRGVTAVFLERRPGVAWHDGMLIDDASMRVSFLKDLVTMRNPTSGFSFAAYLHDRGRLADFINRKTLFPLRVEFHDYLTWAAERVADQVVYGSEVVAVTDMSDDRGEVVAYEVTTVEADGSTATRRARNVVFGIGLRPRVPDGVEVGDRVWHTAVLLDRLDALITEGPERVIVVGAGQSAAEAVAHLHRELPRTEICSVFARYGYAVSDDSPFANRIFDPAAVDDFYFATDEVKARLLDYHRGTNYSVVDLDLIEDLYERTYRETVLGRPRLRMLGCSELGEVYPHPTGVDVEVRSLLTGKSQTLAAAALVLATGYQPADPLALLRGRAAEDIALRPDGRPALRRDHRVRLTTPRSAGLYLHGATEYSHGLGSTLLSTTAVRAGEVLASVLEHRARGIPVAGVARDAC